MREITMKKLVIVLLCSLFVIASVQAVFAAKTTKGSQNNQVVTENAIASAIDINNADIDTLITLPGIGEKTAQKIGAYREANGPFKSVDDLLNVKGIGPKVLEKIRPLVKVT